MINVHNKHIMATLYGYNFCIYIFYISIFILFSFLLWVTFILAQLFLLKQTNENVRSLWPLVKYLVHVLRESYRNTLFDNVFSNNHLLYDVHDVKRSNMLSPEKNSKISCYKVKWCLSSEFLKTSMEQEPHSLIIPITQVNMEMCKISFICMQSFLG